jgi:thioredoxin-related protein
VSTFGQIQKSALMKKVVMSLLMAGLALMSAGAAESVKWVEDLPKAQAQAKEEQKLLWMEFAGSDFCPRCMAMEKEVFAKPEFIEYAQKNLVMVYLDFPEKKILSPDVKKRNDALQEKYKVMEYPTILIFNSKGKKVGELGYLESGPQGYIARLEKLKNKQK